MGLNRSKHIQKGPKNSKMVQIVIFCILLSKKVYYGAIFVLKPSNVSGITRSPGLVLLPMYMFFLVNLKLPDFWLLRRLSTPCFKVNLFAWKVYYGLWKHDTNKL